MRLPREEIYNSHMYTTVGWGGVTFCKNIKWPACDQDSECDRLA